MEFTGERYVPELSGEIRYEHLHRYALALDYAAGRRVLDIASGEGYGAALLARSARSVFGVDIDPDAVAHASRRYADVARLTFLTGACDRIPLPDAAVDVVVSFETLEHHDRHDEMMQEVKRVLAPGGVLVLSSPNRQVYSGGGEIKNGFHVKELFLDELQALLARHFRATALYGQQMATASFVVPLDSHEEAAYRAYTASGDAVPVAVAAPQRTRYFVAVCADDPAVLRRPPASVFADARNDLWLLAQERQEREQHSRTAEREHWERVGTHLERTGEHLERVGRHLDDVSRHLERERQNLDEDRRRLDDERTRHEAERSRFVAETASIKGGWLWKMRR